LEECPIFARISSVMNSSTDLCLISAAPPSNGGQSNFDDPVSLAPVMMAVLSIVVAWATVFTAARLYVNIRKLNWSDCEFESIVEIFCNLSVANTYCADFTLVALVLSIVILVMLGTRKSRAGLKDACRAVTDSTFFCDQSSELPATFGTYQHATSMLIMQK
jgi:hypothetical protein